MSDCTKSLLARVYNEFVTELNKREKLPHYIICMLDKDIIEYTKQDEFSVGRLFKDGVNWLCNEFDKALDLHREDIKSRHPGALWSPIEPRMVWVQMLPRPYIQDKGKAYVFAQCRKFNEVLDDVVLKYKHSHLMKIVLPEEANFFDHSGNLSTTGKIAFWKEVNMVMRSLHNQRLQPVYRFSRGDSRGEKKVTDSPNFDSKRTSAEKIRSRSFPFQKIASNISIKLHYIV